MVLRECEQPFGAAVVSEYVAWVQQLTCKSTSFPSFFHILTASTLPQSTLQVPRVVKLKGGRAT